MQSTFDEELHGNWALGVHGYSGSYSVMSGICTFGIVLLQELSILAFTAMRVTGSGMVLRSVIRLVVMNLACASTVFRRVFRTNFVESGLQRLI